MADNNIVNVNNSGLTFNGDLGLSSVIPYINFPGINADLLLGYRGESCSVLFGVGIIAALSFVAPSSVMLDTRVSLPIHMAKNFSMGPYINYLYGSIAYGPFENDEQTIFHDAQFIGVGLEMVFGDTQSGLNGFFRLGYEGMFSSSKSESYTIQSFSLSGGGKATHEPVEAKPAVLLNGGFRFNFFP